MQSTTHKSDKSGAINIPSGPLFTRNRAVGGSKWPFCPCPLSRSSTTFLFLKQNNLIRIFKISHNVSYACFIHVLKRLVQQEEEQSISLLNRPSFSEIYQVFHSLQDFQFCFLGFFFYALCSCFLSFFLGGWGWECGIPANFWLWVSCNLCFSSIHWWVLVNFDSWDCCFFLSELSVSVSYYNICFCCSFGGWFIDIWN